MITIRKMNKKWGYKTDTNPNAYARTGLKNLRNSRRREMNVPHGHL